MRRRRSDEMRSEGVHPGADAAADDSGGRVGQAPEVKCPRPFFNDHHITGSTAYVIIYVYSPMHKNNAQISRRSRLRFRVICSN